MGKIVKFQSRKEKREEYEYRLKSILLNDEDGSPRLHFFIVLANRETNETICFTRLERFVIDLANNGRTLSETTIRTAMYRVLSFLNFILHNTEINSLNMISEDDIRRFLLWSMKKEDGQTMKRNSWEKKKADVLRFLENYYKYNHNSVEFNYCADDFREKEDICARGRRMWGDAGPRYKSFNVVGPKDSGERERNRSIMYGHLDALRYTALKYDSMIHLAITLQAYAGLREGEVANLSFSDITINRSIGDVSGIYIRLTDSDRYRTGKTHTGVIKKYRLKQQVFPDFEERVVEAIERHKDLLQVMGLPTEGDVPVFYNKFKRPMSVDTMTSRIRGLFMSEFLRVLEETSINTSFEGETLAYIASYRQEYPGAHMFRHWFTNYLITKKGLRDAEVRKWRGDSPNSMAYQQYIDTNVTLIEAYRKSTYSFQKHLLEGLDYGEEKIWHRFGSGGS